MISNSTSHPEPAWLSLGELELPAVGIPAELIRTWLSEILDPFDLPADFLNRVLDSAGETTGRVMLALPEMLPGYLSISIYRPHEAASFGNSWGYFSITRTKYQGGTLDKGFPAIHFYLYPETG